MSRVTNFACAPAPQSLQNSQETAQSRYWPFSPSANSLTTKVAIFGLMVVSTWMWSGIHPWHPSLLHCVPFYARCPFCAEYTNSGGIPVECTLKTSQLGFRSFVSEIVFPKQFCCFSASFSKLELGGEGVSAQRHMFRFQLRQKKRTHTQACPERARDPILAKSLLQLLSRSFNTLSQVHVKHASQRLKEHWEQAMFRSGIQRASASCVRCSFSCFAVYVKRASPRRSEQWEEKSRSGRGIQEAFSSACFVREMHVSQAVLISGRETGFWSGIQEAFPSPVHFRALSSAREMHVSRTCSDCFG